MKYLLIYCIIFFAHIGKVGAQFLAKTSYTITSDDFYKNKIPFAIDVGKFNQISKRVSLYTGLELKYLVSNKRKTRFHDRYQVSDLDDADIVLIQIQYALTRFSKQNSLLVSPNFLFVYPISKKEEVSLIFGFKTILKIYHRYYFENVLYNNDLTIKGFDNIDLRAKANIYGFYLPLGLQYQPSEGRLALNLTIDISLHKKRDTSIWDQGENRNHNLEIGVGYLF